MANARLIRRVFVLFAAMVVSTAFVGAETILVVQTMPVPVIEQHRSAFLNALSVADTDNRIELVEFQADGDYQRAVEFLRQESEKMKPDLVVTFATLATQAAVSVFGPTDGVPVLFAVVVDPVGAGIVDAIGVPSGTNVAGVVSTVDRAVKIATALEILSTAPGFDGVTVGIPHSSYPSSRGDVSALRSAAAGFPDFHIIEGEFGYLPVPDGIPEMRDRMAALIRTMELQVDWWWEAVGPMAERPESVADIRAISERPVLFANRPVGVQDGALLSISPDPVASGRKLAGMALEILAGADPGSFPILAAPDFTAAVNIGTAIRNGLIIPPYFLELAGNQVYQ